MRHASPLLTKLVDLNEKMKRGSICHVCGLPRDGFIAPTDGRVVRTVDDSGSLMEEHIGAISTPKPSMYGYCSCEYVYFYAVDDDRLLKEHRAHGGIFQGFIPALGGVAGLLLNIAGDDEPVYITAADFEEPVYCRIYTEAEPGGCIKVAFVNGDDAECIPPVDDNEAAQHQPRERKPRAYDDDDEQPRRSPREKLAEVA
ncbi:MAG: hypothetical protein ABFD54_04360 [Armatimonadota bacterium]